MSDYPMLISNKLHSFRNFLIQIHNLYDRPDCPYHIIQALSKWPNGYEYPLFLLRIWGEGLFAVLPR